MVELAAREGDTLACVRVVVLRNLGEAARADDVAAEAHRRWWTSRSVVDRALAALVSKGLLSKPRRGYYVPTEETR